MKIEFDYKNKTVFIDGEANLEDVVNKVKRAVDDWKEWAICHKTNDTPTYIPIYPGDWWRPWFGWPYYSSDTDFRLNDYVITTTGTSSTITVQNGDTNSCGIFESTDLTDTTCGYYVPTGEWEVSLCNN